MTTTITCGSYIQAGITCMPVLGLVMITPNLSQVQDELLKPISSQMKISRCNLVRALSNADKTQEFHQKYQELAPTEKEELKACIPGLEKGRIYAICGFVGAMLTIATIISLVAFGILSTPTLVFGALPAFVAYWDMTQFQHYSQVLKAIQNGH